MAPFNGMAVKINDRLPDGVAVQLDGMLHMSRLDYHALAWSCAHHEVIRLIREMFDDARKQLLGKNGSEPK